MEIKVNGNEAIITTKATYLPGVAAAVTFKNKDFFYEDKDTKARVLPTSKEKVINYIPWGSDNLYPNNVIELAEKNPVASALLDFKTELQYGSGIKIGKMINNEFVELTNEEFERNDEFKKVKEFFEDNNLNLQVSESLIDINWWGTSPIELIINNKGDAIAEINTKEMAFTRWEEMDSKGRINTHIYYAKWDQAQTDDDYIFTPVLDFKKPQLDLKRRMGISPNLNGKKEATKNKSYIYPISFASPARRYYPMPPWHSIIKSGWLDFANAIPIFKKALMTNMINVKYHIEISMDYFPRIFSEEGITTKDAMEARVKQEYTNIQDFLTGQENVGKPIITYFKITPDGKVDIPDIRINVIDNKVGGEYNEDSQEASAMIYTAFRVHPNVISVIPSKTNSNLSGSDKRELLRIHQTFTRRIRNEWYSLLNMVKSINQWPAELVFSINDIVLTTLDQGKEVQSIPN